MLTLDVEHATSTDTLRILGPDELGDADTPSLQSARIERKLTRQPEQADTAEVVVYRDAWGDVEQDLDRTDDRFVIREDGTPIFGGRLADFERDGVVVSVLIDSPKRDAIDAEPSGGNDVYPPQPDSTLVTDELLARVPTVDAGTVETVDTDIAFSESHASPGKSITKLARDADAEARYRTTDTAFKLDYQARLGADRTAETLSPESATVLGEPRVREQVTEDVTHVRVLGAGEGTAQVEATAVASSYDSADDRAVYRQRADKDIQEQSRAQALAETLVDEYDGAREYVEVEFEVPRSVDPALGDEFTVQLPAHDIDTTLRITMLERLLDDAGDRFRAILSNRRHTADLQGAESAVELNSLSEGNAGQYYALSDGEGWDAVGAGEPYQFSFYRPPNTIGELRSVLRLESRPYRLRSDQTPHTHALTVDETSAAASASAGTREVATAVTTQADDGQDATLFSLTLSEDIRPAYLNATILPTDATVDTSVRVNNVDTQEEIQAAGGQTRLSELDGNRIGAALWSAKSGDTIELRADNVVVVSGADPAELVTNVEVFGPTPGHTHSITAETTTASTAGVDPGIVEQNDETVSDVDVTVAGTEVATGLDHPIDESIDLSDLLADGRNDIQITSESLGELRARVEYEALKNADSR